MTSHDQLDLYIQGHLAGRVVRANGHMTFVFEPSYRDNPEAVRLSLSFPMVGESFAGPALESYIAALLPDNPTVLRRWATRFDTLANPFDLMFHVGQDLPGAVQLVPANHTPDRAQALIQLSQHDVAERIRALRQDAAEWAPVEGARWSLAGAQGKFALTQLPDGSWAEPSGSAPSTHIFKVGMSGYDHGDAAEFVTMRAARLLGLTTAAIRVEQFEDQIATVVARYDRRLRADGTVERLHQEDMCQALGLPPSLKYQADGGPSASQVVELLANTTSGANWQAAQRAFVEALVFNLLVAAPDAHGRNYSILHIGRQVALAPLYDLISAPLLANPVEVWNKWGLAMKFGGKYRFNQIGTHQVLQAANELRLLPGDLIDIIRRLHTGLPAAMTQAADDAGPLIDHALRERFAYSIGHHCNSLGSWIDLLPHRPVPPAPPAPRPPQPRIPRGRPGGGRYAKAPRNDLTGE